MWDCLLQDKHTSFIRVEINIFKLSFFLNLAAIFHLFLLVVFCQLVFYYPFLFFVLLVLILIIFFSLMLPLIFWFALKKLIFFSKFEFFNQNICLWIMAERPSFISILRIFFIFFCFLIGKVILNPQIHFLLALFLSRANYQLFAV